MNKTKIIQNHLMEQGATWLNNHGGADGIWGQATQKAYADYNEQYWMWPRYQDLNAAFGAPNLVDKTHPSVTYIIPPYQMYLAWLPTSKVTRMAVHTKVAESLGFILSDILEYYKADGIIRHGLNQFGGTLNVRNMRGGDRLSTHSYAAAIDIDPIRNQFKWNKNKAYIPNHCPELIDIFRAYGWVSLGAKQNYDWQHFQAVRL